MLEHVPRGGLIASTIQRLDQGRLFPPGEHPGGQTLSLPPPEIEPGSTASQAGTQPKELSRQLLR